MEEIWKDIEGYEGLYQVSNTGKIKSLDKPIICNKRKGIRKGKMLSLIKDKKWGYYHIMLHKNCNIKTYMVHRLVAQAFISNPLNKPQINHKDGNKLNNNIDNLEWVSNKENTEHAIINGLRKKLTPVIQLKNGVIVGRYRSLRDAEKKTGVSHANLHKALFKGKYKQLGGYQWVLANNYNGCTI